MEPTPSPVTICDFPHRHYPQDTVDWLLARKPVIIRLREQCRAERRRIGLKYITHQRRTWYLSNGNLRTVIAGLMLKAREVAECVCIVERVLDRPWKYRTDFCVARCRELDGGEPC